MTVHSDVFRGLNDGPIEAVRHRDGFLIRICVLSFRTHRDRMDMCFDDIRAALAEVRAHEAG